MLQYNVWAGHVVYDEDEKSQRHEVHSSLVYWLAAHGHTLCTGIKLFDSCAQCSVPSCHRRLAYMRRVIQCGCFGLFLFLTAVGPIDTCWLVILSYPLYEAFVIMFDPALNKRRRCDENADDNFCAEFDGNRDECTLRRQLPINTRFW